MPTGRKVTLLVIHRCETGHTGQEVARVEPGAYHLFIDKVGQVHWALSPGPNHTWDLTFRDRGAHAMMWNADSIGIAVYGCFDEAPEGKLLDPPPHNLHPTQAQLDALEVLIEGLCWWFSKKLFLAGHTELPRASRDPLKVCPGRNLRVAEIRQRLGLKLPNFPDRFARFAI